VVSYVKVELAAISF